MNRSKHLLNITIVILAIAFLAFTACVRRGTNQPPSAVINIYPVLSELVDENNFYAKWTQSVDPEGREVRYKINYAKTMEGLDDPRFFETTENYFLLPNLSEGVWYWQVTAIDSAGNETQSPIWNFTINGDSLPQPTNPEEIPPDPSLIVSQVENTSFTLDWPAYEDKQDPSKPIQYNINIYDKGSAIGMRNAIRDIQRLLRTTPATTAHTTDTSHTFNHMKSQTLYDWVIIAQNNASQTSVVGSSGVKTGNRAPSQPELITPTDDATDVATDVTLNWSASTDPDGDDIQYYVYIDIVKNTNRNVTVEGIEATSYQPDGLEKGRTYYWFILVKDSNGAATRTQTQAFMTQSDGMDVPHSPTPADNSQNIDAVNPPLLQWEHDKNNQPISYNVYLSDNPKKITLEAEGLSQKAYQIPNKLKGNSKYYWQVEAIDSQSGQTTRSGVWTFKTAVIDPPTQTHAQTNTDGTQIEITYNKAMADPEGKHSQYTVKKEQTPAQANRPTPTYQTIPTSKIAIKPGTTNIYVLTLESKLNDTDNIKIDYTQGTIQAKDGGKLQSYQNYPVMNKVPGEAPKVTSSKTLVTGNATQTNQIQIQFDKAMKAPPETAANQFSFLANGNTQAIDTIEQNPQEPQQYILTLTGAIVYGQSLSLNYTKGSVQATNEAYLESFAGQPVDNTVNPVAPQLEDAQTNAKGTLVTLTFDKTMQIEGDQAGQFRVTAENTTHPRTGQSVTDARVMSDEKKIALTLAYRIEHGQTIAVSYTPGTIKSQEGAQLQAFTQTVTTAVAEPPTVNSLYTDNTGEQLTLTFDKAMKTPENEEGNFSLTINRVTPNGARQTETIAITQVERGNNTRQYTLTPEEAINNGDSATLTYNRGTIESEDEGWLNHFTKGITNVVEGDSPVVKAATLTADGQTLTVAFNMKMEANPYDKVDQFAIRVAGEERTIDNITRSDDEKTYTFTIEEAALFQQRVTLVYLKGTVKAKYGTYLESFTREADNLVNPVGPQVQSVLTNTRGDWITLTFDKAMEAPAASEKDNFSLSLNPPANTQRKGAGIDIQSATLSNTDATLMGLKLTGRIEYNTSWNLTYNPGAIETTEGATLAAFNKPVTNNAPVEPTVKDAYSSEDGQTITVRFSKDMKDDPKKDGFSVSVQAELNGQRTGEATITDIERDDVNDRLYNLTLEQALDDTDVATLIYARQHNDTDVESLDDGWLNNFTQTIRNGVPPEKPLCLSATMTADGKQVELGFDKEMVLDDPEEKQYQQFGVLVEGYVNEITAATLKAGHPNIIVLTLAIPVGKNNEVHVSYTRGTVKSENGGELESFQNKRVNTDNLDVIWVAQDIGWNYDSIQTAIDAAEDKATVMVWPGTYVENIDFEGKELHVTSTSPTDQEVRENTQITPADQNSPVVTIAGNQTETTILEGFKITEAATGIYCETATPVIRYNSVDATNCTVILKAADSTLLFNDLVSKRETTVYMTDSKPLISNNDIRALFKNAVYMNNSEPIINDNSMGSTDGVVIEASTPTIYGNEIFTYVRNGFLVDADSNVKNEEGNLWQVFNVPYARQADVENYTDGATSNTFIPHAGTGDLEGDYIFFEREATHTKDGTFTLSPATATSNDGEDITIIATYTLAESFSNGTVTYDVDPAIDMDEVYITINGNRRPVTDKEKGLSGQNSQARMQELNKINIKDICAEANEKIVLEIIQSSYLFEQEIFSGSERNGYLPNQNGMFVQVDRDGPGSLYTASDPEVGSVDIENNLEYIGSEATAYGITDNGETFYSYTVKVFKDKMPEKLRTILEWEIEIRGTSEGTYYFRANQFDENVLQYDEIPNNTGITEENIKEARFEPKQETPD